MIGLVDSWSEVKDQTQQSINPQLHQSETPLLFETSFGQFRFVGVGIELD